MTVLICVTVAFLVGSVPFSLWLSRLTLRVDIRRYGDGNPGAGNAWRAGGWRVGLPGALLDYSKGAVPVVVAHHSFGISRWALAPVALAPVVGHAFSPFLRGRGGKAVAATFGLWTALTAITGVLTLGVTMGFFWALQRADGWSTVFGLGGLLTYLLVFAPHPYLLTIWAADAGIVTWKHRRDLREAHAAACLSVGKRGRLGPLARATARVARSASNSGNPLAKPPELTAQTLHCDQMVYPGGRAWQLLAHTPYVHA